MADTKAEKEVRGFTFPVRCWTCGKVQIWDPYETKLNQGISPDEALDQLKIRRECCRTQYLTFDPNLEDDLLLYDPKQKSGDPRITLVD